MQFHPTRDASATFRNACDWIIKKRKGYIVDVTYEAVRRLKDYRPYSVVISSSDISLILVLGKAMNSGHFNMNNHFVLYRALLTLVLFFTLYAVAHAQNATIPSHTTDPLITPLTAETRTSNAAEEAAQAYAAGDLAKARTLWEELAAKGDGQAMNNLGVLHDQGLGVAPDSGRALHWFAQSANAGNPSGMNNYGRMLQHGRAIPANPEEAARWFDLAARQGQPEAQYNLGYLYESGQGVPQDDSAAAAWYSRAASLRQKDALARLGHFYRIGRGVSQDKQRAVLLLYGAAMEGSKSAINELEAMAKENPGKGNAALFGQKLDATNRDDMRAALQKAGAKIKTADDKHICDVYEAGSLVPGAGEMAICYGPDKKLAFLKIDYPAEDKNRADAVLKMVESRFGSPTAGEGEDASLWNLGSVIVATQYAPTHKHISLMYLVPRVYHLTQSNK